MTLSSCQVTDLPNKTHEKSFSIALVGNPNCGKTTVFNALTGARQRVGNWPGVTVERKSGYFVQAETSIEVIDLPGLYSLTIVSDNTAIDEHLAAEYILQGQTDLIINIVDASNLERHLYLTIQLIEMQIPIVLALNMMDVARSRKLHIQLQKLAQALGCPVVALQATKGGGIDQLKQVIANYDRNLFAAPKIHYSQALQEAIDHLLTVIPQINSKAQAIKLLENDKLIQANIPEHVLARVHEQQVMIQDTTDEEADILFADARYQFIQQTLKECLTIPLNTNPTWTTRIDRIVLNRILGVPIFLCMMYLLFVFAINVGGAFQDFFDISSQTIFVDGFAHLLTVLGMPTWLIALLANGVGKGINTTITFIPVIGSMFLFLAFLEDSGYMARAAFVIDRFMRALGLPGKAFVPMIVGFGCNVPSIMGARTLENKRDRILTIMMAPFMSCGARLAIFAVFTTVFFPQGGQNIVFALYLIGILMAVMTGFLLRQTVLKGEAAPLVMELPIYHLPKIKTLGLHAWQRLKSFVLRAGKLIIPICLLIGALNSINLDGSLNSGEGDTHSLLSTAGQWATPVFKPMGIEADNWPATVGLVTGVLAKEVVVGTLNTLYTQAGHLTAGATETFQFWGGLKEAVQSIPANLIDLQNAFTNPILAKAPIKAVNEGVYGLMYKQFDGQIGAFAYLLFILLYFPCISTMAVMLRELHRGWSVFSGLWMTGVAYGTAVGFYQAATFTRHPTSSAMWLSAIMLTFFSTIFLLRWYSTEKTQ